MEGLPSYSSLLKLREICGVPLKHEAWNKKSLKAFLEKHRMKSIVLSSLKLMPWPKHIANSEFPDWEFLTDDIFARDVLDYQNLPTCDKHLLLSYWEVKYEPGQSVVAGFAAACESLVIELEQDCWDSPEAEAGDYLASAETEHLELSEEAKMGLYFLDGEKIWEKRFSKDYFISGDYLFRHKVPIANKDSVRLFE
jgi:hypothetical protein